MGMYEYRYGEKRLSRSFWNQLTAGAVCAAVLILFIILQSTSGTVTPPAENNDSDPAKPTVEVSDIEIMESSTLYPVMSPSTLTAPAYEFPGAATARQFCTSLPPTPGDRRRNPERLRIMHFNVKFGMTNEVFSTVQKSSTFGGKKAWKDNTQHLKEVGAWISTFDADVIGVCEIIDCQSLEMIRQQFTNKDQYYVYLPKQRDNNTYQGCGFISKIDPESIENFTESVQNPVPTTSCPGAADPSTTTDKKGPSKGVRALFNIDNVPIAMYSTHLLAFPDDKSRCTQREAQGATIAREVSGEGDWSLKWYGKYGGAQNVEVIVMGDMNDYDVDKDGGALNDPEANKRISNAVVYMREGLGTATGQVYGKTTQTTEIANYERTGLGKLRNVAWSIPRAQRRSTMYQNKWWVIDHMLVSNRLYSSIKAAQFPGSWFSEQSGDFWTDPCSDHYPIVMDVSMKVLKQRREAYASKPQQAPEPTFITDGKYGIYKLEAQKENSSFKSGSTCAQAAIDRTNNNVYTAAAPAEKAFLGVDVSGWFSASSSSEERI